MSKIPKGKRVALYLRVSHAERTVENQRQALLQWAEYAGLEVTDVYTDEGISGAKGRDKRPGFDAMLKDATRRKFDVLASWSVDRLGRSLTGLLDTLQELHGAGVDLYLHQQAVDTRTPAGKAMFQMMGVFAEFERAMIQERVKAGMSRARSQGKHVGRPSVPEATRERLRELLRGGMGQLKAARECGVGTSVAQEEARKLREEVV
ncbi:recombinase family protein [Stenotrophomonas sp. PS02300]|uniref:recombinase family protein n=1 Tax=Stenotrophomonas sp. PS02300 TaxID=2991426 RepID=UPI00249C187B|nr:recombinase family protein [Stenotrophomonas sp. PS02300]